LVSKRERLFAAIPAGMEEWVANRLVSAHFRILPAFVLGHLVNAALLVAMFINAVPATALISWFAGMALACGHRLIIPALSQRKGGSASWLTLLSHLNVNSAILAILGVVAFNWLFPLGSAMDKVFLAILGTSLLGAAGFTMRTIPKAAIAYIAIVTVGMTLGLLQTGSAESLAAGTLLVMSGILFCRMSIMAHRLFVVRILKERDATDAAETVRMLLNDYEDQGSDWLFELDEDGRVIGASPRFGAALGLAPADLNGTAFADLFDESAERGQLLGHLTERRSFRALAVPLAACNAAERKWWSVSGRATGGTRTAASFRGVISDISAEKQAEARVRHMALYDSLTELPNRLMFATALHREMANRHDAARLALLLVDFDNFKQVNDMYGHGAGDQFLKLVSHRLTEIVGENGLGGQGRIVARLGGDEFAVLMSSEDVYDVAIRLASRLVEAFAEAVLLDGHEINSGVSVGIAIAPNHGNTAQVIQSNADIALYVAKNGGRGRWEMFEPGMDVAVQQRHAIERDLRSALVNDELRLYLQPLVDVETGDHTGFEALIRWEHPERGLVMPNDFIPIAEETGLIVPMGEWVIRTAMAEAATWREERTIAVNLSPVQLRSPNLLPTIVNALAETGIDPARLEVEITESVLLNDCEANIAVLNRLHDLGVKIALDDFGTGYASLNYLRTFPFDKIKIDRSFVTDLPHREDCRAIVGAVISLANKLGMCTLAEGVEDERQLAQLRAEGCEMVQGWLFGKAMPVEHYAELRVPGPARRTAAPARLRAKPRGPRRKAA
jgi:diguanylate cyclase (GGDEF)-like protein